MKLAVADDPGCAGGPVGPEIGVVGPSRTR
jgi:hypothetical protein